jgi:hypothetical protein
MNLEPTIEQLIRMMEYLKVWSFVIPSYNMAFPAEIDNVYWRPEKVFRFLRSGIMTYSGSGDLHKADAHIGGVMPTQAWIDRAYIHLTQLVQGKVKLQMGKSTFPHIGELLLRFNGMDFIDNNTLNEVNQNAN